MALRNNDFLDAVLRLYLEHHPDSLHGTQVSQLLDEPSSKVHPLLIGLIRRGVLEVTPHVPLGEHNALLYRLTPLGLHIAQQPLLRRFGHLGPDGKIFLLLRPRVRILRSLYAQHPEGVMAYEIGEELQDDSDADVRRIDSTLRDMARVGLVDRTSLPTYTPGRGRAPQENHLTPIGLELAAAVSDPNIPLSAFPAYR